MYSVIVRGNLGKKERKKKKLTNAPASIATSPPLPSFDIDTVRPAAVVVFPQTKTDLGATAAAALNNWLWKSNRFVNKQIYEWMNEWISR